MEQTRIAAYRAYFDQLDATEDTAVAGAPTSYKSWHNSKTIFAPAKMVKYIATCMIDETSCGFFNRRYPDIIFRAHAGATKEEVARAFDAEFSRQFPLRFNPTLGQMWHTRADRPEIWVTLKDVDIQRAVENPTTAQRIARDDRRLRQYYRPNRNALSPYKG